MDLILAIIFCYQLNRMAKERGLRSFPYVMNFIMGVVMMELILGFAFIYFYGSDALFTDAGRQTLLYFAPVSISFEVFMFIWFRNRIRKSPIIEDTEEEEDEHHSPHTPGEKKDLSYFR